MRCGKGSKRRILPINNELADLLQQYLSSIQTTDPECPLFKSQKDGSRLSTQAIDRVIRIFGKQAGVELSCHTLRHCFVTALIRNNQDIVVVAELAGHARLDTTRKYCLPTQADMLSAVQSLSQEYAQAT